MIAIGTQERANRRRRPLNVEGSTFYKGEWMESGEDPRLSPTVFLAEQPPDYRLTTHFHRQNQFQLFVEGSGSLGSQRTDPVTVHYAGAYTGYGPLLSGPDGLKYFTIRPVFDTGFIPASEAREKMVRGPKRHAAVALGAPWPDERLAALRDAEDRFALAPERGLAVRHLRLPPHARLDVAHVEGSVGTFVFVLAGTMNVDGQVLQRWESVFASADDRLVVGAGDSGGEYVALHVPPTEPEYLPQDR